MFAAQQTSALLDCYYNSNKRSANVGLVEFTLFVHETTKSFANRDEFEIANPRLLTSARRCELCP